MSGEKGVLDGVRRFSARALRGVARRIEPADLWAFLDARQGELGNVLPLDVSALIAAYVAAKGECRIVQIGANSGNRNDPVESSIRELGLPAILIEPQANVFATLKANYANQPQVILERAAIASETGEVELFKVNSDFWAHHNFPADADSQISSLNREQIGRTVEIFGGARLREDESAYLEVEVVPALSLAALLAKHGIDQIDLLAIDTEGFDFEVIRMVDFQNSPPAMILYETIHLELQDRLGAWNLLRENGYKLFASDNHNTIAIRAEQKADR